MTAPGGVWPQLRVADWEPTRDTLTLWLQVVGKVRIARAPLLKHWWNCPLYLTGRGLTTSLIPGDAGRSRCGATSTARSPIASGSCGR